MLSAEFVSFYDAWMRKSSEYNDENLRDCFDKYFSLYVIYNRLYAEAAFTLVREGSLVFRGESFPDAQAATKYIVNFLGHDKIVNTINIDPEANEGVKQVVNFINEGRFHIILGTSDGGVRLPKDRKLARDLVSEDLESKADAIVLLVYQIRCNMFHGNKSFEGVQRDLLINVIPILKALITCTYNELQMSR